MSRSVRNWGQELIVAGLLALLNGWFFMLGVAVLSAHWWHELPTIGFFWSVVAVALLRGTMSAHPGRLRPGGGLR